MQYNTQMKKMVLPEYGRSIQKLVDHCTAITDADERLRCAQGIIQIMGNLFPYLRDTADFSHKLWDHLAIMSDFKLDIPYPCEVVKQENLISLPNTVPYTNGEIRFKHYGRFLEGMIEKAAEMEPGEERDELISLLAHQMKKSYLTWNKEGADNEKVLNDLRIFSRGRIDLDPAVYKLREMKELPIQPLQPNSKLKTKRNNRKR